VDNDGWTLLHSASQTGHLEVVKLLLRRGASVDALNKANQTAAELALENDQAEVAKFIAEYKADASIRNKIRSTTLDTGNTGQHGADEDGEDLSKTSLHSASYGGNIGIVEVLLERGADINGCDENGQSPLIMAASGGRVDVVRLLIERGAEVDSRNRWGWTALLFASRLGHLEVSRVLIDHGANVSARKLDRSTPLHLSVGIGHLEIVNLLLEHGADVYAVNDNGETPYQLSLQNGYRAISDLLWEHGASGERLDEIFLWVKCDV
jgi:ankyrin repeat protein